MRPPSKILHVDDDADIRFITGMALETVGGFTILQCASGREALAAAPGFQPDLLLLDMMMPEMDGYEAMRRIREQARFSKLPMLALTAKAMKDDRAKCIEAGANDYCSKPIDMAKLTSLLRVWLHKSLPLIPI